MPMTEEELDAYEKERDLGQELLESVHQMNQGIGVKVLSVPVPLAKEARESLGMNQSEFAHFLSVSVRTLQDWEIGRRQPSSAAKKLLLIAMKRPDVLKELSAF